MIYLNIFSRASAKMKYLESKNILQD